MTLPSWDGVEVDTPEFNDKIEQAIAALDAAERRSADFADIERSVRWSLRLAMERAMHAEGLCSKWGYTAFRPGG